MRLELDHRWPKAFGGSDDEENVRVLCRAHNHLEAERAFGGGFIAKRIAARRAARSSKDVERFEKAKGALATMGFRAGEACRAIAEVRAADASRVGAGPKVEDIRRAALAVLCRADARACKG